jgi:hypothetical protein
MLSKFAALISLGVVLIFVGCEKKAATSVPSPAQERAQSATSSSIPSQRFIAVRHKLEIIAPESDLPKAWDSTIAFCGTIQCEIISSSITTRVRGSFPSGSISVRVKSDDLMKLFAQIGAQGKIVQHTTESEDKTGVVIDTDARIKNLTSFRDSLRTMLAKSSASVKDLVEIQRQLTDVQSQLDSETAQRKNLANETEKVAVEITFQVDESILGVGFFVPISDALRESGAVLADSVASLITVIVAVLPWLVLVVPIGWLLTRYLRKQRRKRPLSVPTQPGAPTSSNSSRSDES